MGEVSWRSAEKRVLTTRQSGIGLNKVNLVIYLTEAMKAVLDL